MNRKRNKRNGWPARRRYRRELDLVARSLGHRNYRTMDHERKVARLREILRQSPNSSESEWFTTSEVADAIRSTPKRIRWLAALRLITHGKLPGEQARKLWFTAGAVRHYLDLMGIGIDSLDQPQFARLLRSVAAEKLGFAKRGAFTKQQAADELKIGKRGIDYYLKSGALIRSPLSSRHITLITRESLLKLAWRRIDEAERDYKSAKLKFERAEKRRKRICG